MYLFIFLSISPSIHLFIHRSTFSIHQFPFIHLFNQSFIYPSFYLSIHPSICLSIHSHFHSSTIHSIILCSSFYLSLHLFIHRSTFSFINFIYPFIHLFTHSFIHPSIYLFIHPMHPSIYY